ncbi:hypothetical protein [Marinobacter salexigens]|uniref:Uncharacterized protein n=1 Tax=Marinobacter salexigens TaxID=1925763 RepID=A0ABS6A5M5_9GAMM|nr:hypothetical protein [Marinobacter salexigens]MBU2872995.1 hypothetical protein [Marinobacter salexigens]
MKQIILIVLVVLSFNASAEVSNYKYNSLVDEYRELAKKHSDFIDKYNDLVDKYNELIFNNIMSEITKIQLNEEIFDVIAVGDRALHGYGNRCILGSTVYTADGKEYTISFNFDDGIGWSKPSKFRDSIKINGTSPGVIVIARPEDKVKELQRLFIEDYNLREELAKMFKKLHEECYTS